MRFLIFTILLFVFAIQVTDAQEQSTETADRPYDGWKTVLDAGTLEPQPDIVVIDGGFVVAAESFEDPSRRFGSPWMLFDPVTGAWSDYETPPVKWSLLDLNEELLTLLNIADLVPDVPDVKYQLVDGGNKLAFLLPDDDMYDEWSLYTSVLIVDPASKTANTEYVWYCQGPPLAELVVWDFPDQNLSVICNTVIHHDGDSIRTERTFDFIGRNAQSALYLISLSPNHRYWIMREDEVFFDDSGNFYVYDRQTRQTTVMLWSLPHKPQRDFVFWLSSSSLLTNAGEYILHLDLEDRTRRELMREELAALPGDAEFRQPTLSTDGQWLLVASEDGSLLLGNVFAAIAKVDYFASSRDQRHRPSDSAQAMIAKRGS